MSDLQLSLLALGAVIIAGVILFNWWQERRFMQESMRRFETLPDDVLMDEFRIDPDVEFESEPLVTESRFDDDDPVISEDVMLEELHPHAAAKAETPIAAPEPTAKAPRFEEDEQPLAMPDEPPFSPDVEEAPATQPRTPAPVAEAAPAATEAAAPAEPEPAPINPLQPIVSSMPEEVDEQVDLIGRAALPGALDIAALLQAIGQMPKFDKPVRWFLQDENGFWRTLSVDLPSAAYPQLACALQLADRAGPVSQGSLLAFREQALNLVTILGGKLEWHGAIEPLEYAAELDRFCIEVDVMVGFHILQGASGSFAGTKLRGLAEAGGMELQDDGAFHLRDDQGRTLFTLVSQDQRPFKPETLRTVFYRGVSFQLDVPKVANCAEAFNRMVDFARQMEVALEGTLVDDNQRALGETEIEKIRQQLKGIQSKMVSRFILPGTPTAIRLFS